MSSPMDISVPNLEGIKISNQNGVPLAPPLALPSNVPHEKFHVSVEVFLKPSSTARPDNVQKAVEQSALFVIVTQPLIATMGSSFNPQILVEKLAKLNNSQASIESILSKK
ncbi:hypothetical protein Gotur_017345 [Gossypium turneri]